MKFIVVLSTILTLNGTVRYVAQSAGTFSGGTACNGQTAITPATFNGLTLSAGDTTYICGTLTAAADASLLSIGQSGSSGNVISLIFDTGAVLTAPYWSSSGAIHIASVSWIVVDGGTNGTITSTANGTSLANVCSSGDNCNSHGVYLSAVSNSEVKNLTISNMYVHVCSAAPPFTACTDNSGTQGTAAIYWAFGSNVIIDHNTINDAYAGIDYIYQGSTTSSGVNVHHNTVTNTNWSIVAGSGAASALLNTLQVNNNSLSGWDNWNTSTNAYHHDGIFIFTQAANDLVTNPVVNANYIGSPTTLMTGQIFIDSANAGSDVITGAMISNNVIFNPSSNTTGCPGGYVTLQATNTIIANNTIAASIPGPCTGDSNDGNDAVVLAGTGSVYLNNVATNCNYGFLSSSGSSIATSDYNDMYNCSFFGQQEPASANATLASWHSAYPSLDTHSLSSNPNLTSTYGPNSGSVLIGAGTNLTATYCGTYPLLCSDYAGYARPSSGAWDIGAYQFVQLGTFIGGPLTLAGPGSLHD